MYQFVTTQSESVPDETRTAANRRMSSRSVSPPAVVGESRTVFAPAALTFATMASSFAQNCS